MLQPSLQRLSIELNETVDLAVLDGGEVLFVAQHPAPERALMAIARVGAHFPAYSLASGKVLLAQLPRGGAPAPAAAPARAGSGWSRAHARGAAA